MTNEGLSFDPEQTRAVLIATTKTSDPALEKLNQTKRDLNAFKDVLINPKIVGIPEENLLPLVDQPLTEIGVELDNFAQAATDTLLIYYAGHGLISAENSSELLLATPETTLQQKDLNSLPFKRVSGIMKRSKAKRKILILDCCYSGKAIKSLMGSSPKVAGDAFVLCSSHANDPSLAPKDKTYTTFTSALLGVLGSGLSHVDEPVLTLKQLFRALHDKLKDPEPQSQAFNNGGDIALALNVKKAQQVPAPRQWEGRERTAKSISEAERLGLEQIERRKKRKARREALGRILKGIAFYLLCLVIAAWPTLLILIPQSTVPRFVLKPIAYLTFGVYGSMILLILAAYIFERPKVKPLADWVFGLDTNATEQEVRGKVRPVFLAFLIGFLAMIVVAIFLDPYSFAA
ncbi:caspase family protein [Acidobacteria bacterium AH-259-G07]|nr:caspase family protein [Acidobacteria bacterium AH-259-G07]